MRLIDAEKLFSWGDHKLSDAVKYGNADADQQHWSYSTVMMYEVADEIDDAPTIDAVPVVRCRDCVRHTTCKTAFQYGLGTDGFCSAGVAKEHE